MGSLARVVWIVSLILWSGCLVAGAAEATFDHRVLATNKTSTMQKELREAGEAGFRIAGVTVAKTAFGGAELVSILRKD